MKRFDHIKQILDTLVDGKTIGGHGAFWRNLTHAQFLTERVFGQQVVQPGNSAQSALVRALRAQNPFGSDAGTAGAFFRRMPAGRPPATTAQIDYIARWIDDGCPDDDDPGLQTFVSTLAFTATQQNPARHNAYWREFDNWAMYHSPAEVKTAIDSFFGVAPLWLQFAKSPDKEPAWAAEIQLAHVLAALAILSGRQRTTVERTYGTPINLDELFDSYLRFGSGTLPPDPLRKDDPDHKMNSPVMWFFWAAFADACLRSNIDADFWATEARAILVGLLHEGLFRHSFTVQGFSPDAAGSANVLAYAKALNSSQLAGELRKHYRQSGL